MKKLLLFLSLAICCVCNAATYYISPTGNDATGNGTISNPWKTLFKATSTVTSSGNIIHVNAGIYTETQQSNLAVGVSIEGDGVTSVIKAGFASSPLISMTSNSEGTNGNQYISNIKVDGNSLTGITAIRIFARSNVVIHDCTFVDFHNDGITFNGRISEYDAPPTIFATGNQFYNNTVTNCSWYNVYGHGALQIGGQDGMLIHDNIMSQTGRSTGTNGYVMKYFSDGYIKAVKIYNNSITKQAFDGITFDFALELWNLLGGVEIYNNTIIGSTDINNASKGSYAYSLDFHDNTVGPTTVQANTEFGFYLEPLLGFVCNDVIVRDNYFRNLDIAITTENRPGTTVNNLNVYRNLFWQTKATFFNSQDVNNTISNFNFWNNTLYSSRGLLDGIELPSTGTATNISIRNNIIVGYTRSPISAFSIQAGATINTMSIENNDFYNNGNNNVPLYSGITPTNVTNQNNLTSDPLFIGNANYQLQGGSPCIDAGINVGLPFNGNAPDIGYAEYGSASIPSPPIVGTITHPTCAVATGSVVLSGLPSSGSWTLTRTPGGVTTTGTGTSVTITGLPAGTYNYTVSNGSSTSAPSANIVINTQPVTPSAPTVGTITHPTCAVATGSVVLNGLPASGTWTLTRTPGAVTTTGTGTSVTITGIVAGTFTYTVTNSSGCISVASANVVINTQPATPSAPVVGTITHPTCAVATGSVVLNGLPASGTWTLTRTPGGVTTTGTGTSTTITGLAPGTYTYTVTNSSGCISVASANVVINAQPATPSAPVVGTITHPTCAVATGSVVLNGLPASGTWTLIRTPGGVTTTGTGTSVTITGLAPGTYNYTVTNSSGCISAASVDIIINAEPATPATPGVGTITHPTCAVATGSVVLNGLPASGTWTLTRMPGGVTTTGTGTSVTISGLPAGTYNYTVTNSSGCISAASADVVINVQPATPSVPTVGTITHPTCAVATGTVVLNGLPSGTWTLTRTPGAVTTTGTGTSVTITGIVAGTFTYTVTNASGCISAASANVVINAQPATPSAPAVGTITHPTCAVATGSVVLNGLPATGTWTLTRTPGAVTTTGTGTSTTITGLPAGTYNYTVTNASGCVSAVSADVVINPQPATPSAPAVGSITQPTSIITTGSVVLNGLPSTGTWTLTRMPDGNTITGTGTSVTITGLAPGTYTFTVTNTSGCSSTTSANVVINTVANIPPTAIAGPDQIITLPVNFTSLNGLGLDTDGNIVGYEWKQLSGPSTNVLFSLNTAATYVNNLVEGIYEFELTVTDNGGAKGRDTVNITVVNLPGQAAQNNSIKIYPNPVVGIATLEITKTNENPKVLEIITDAEGKHILVKELSSSLNNIVEKIDMTSLAKGTYFVTVVFKDEERKTLKVIKGL